MLEKCGEYVWQGVVIGVQRMTGGVHLASGTLQATFHEGIAAVERIPAVLADRQLEREVVHTRWNDVRLVMGHGISLLHVVHVTVEKVRFAVAHGQLAFRHRLIRCESGHAVLGGVHVTFWTVLASESDLH
ncbi:MAG TPA: hypothetical protein VNU46_00165, partial [Gemmatimonadaceae bacterium]|nr:hypothetical protein [Gemmatimonadaceae bacterium]